MVSGIHLILPEEEDSGGGGHGGGAVEKIPKHWEILATLGALASDSIFYLQEEWGFKTDLRFNYRKMQFRFCSPESVPPESH